jgi:hypothetical protein
MRSVYFVKYTDWVSTILGADQIAAALRERGFDAWSVTPADIGNVRDAIVVFIKSSRWWHVERARWKRNLTVLDVHDAMVFDGRVKNQRLVDGIIWRNRRQLADFACAGQINCMLHQQWDPRYAANRAGGAGIAIGYFGVPRSFPHWQRIPGAACHDRNYFQSALDYNCHLSVRAPGREYLYKPNCKVSTASACAANLVTTRDESALDLLGEDYPYYLDSAELESVLAGIEHARATFGGPEWRMGLERMREVRDKTSIDRAIAGYLDFFAQLGG